MGDLIDRDALLAECAEAQKSDPYFEERGWANHFINVVGEPSTEWGAVEDMICIAPAVDAVCVVRCKDCKNWDEDSGVCYENSSYFYCFLSEEDFYCKAGCKKDGV